MKAPKLVVDITGYGFQYAGIRPLGETEMHIKTYQYILMRDTGRRLAEAYLEDPPLTTGRSRPQRRTDAGSRAVIGETLEG